MEEFSIIHLVYGMGLGGIEMSVAKLALDQKKRGCNVIVVCLYENGQVGRMIESEGISVVALNLRRGLGLMNLVLPLKRICSQKNPDVLHVHLVGVEIPVMLTRFFGKVKKCILTVRAFEHYSGWRFYRARLFARLAGYCYDRIVCISTALKEHEINYIGRKPQELTVVWNAVDTAKFCPRPVSDSQRAEALGLGAIEPGAFVLGMGVQLKPFKDIPTFIRAARLIKKRQLEKVLFIVAGTGPLEAELKQSARKLDIEKCFKFVGAIQDMPRFLNAIDALVLTSPFEGLGVIVLEAMAVGKPVIVTDSGGVRDSVTDGQTGFIVPVGDDEKLARAILDLMENPQLGRQMGKAGLARACKDFAIEKYTQAYWNLIKN